jgi:amidase
LLLSEYSALDATGLADLVRSGDVHRDEVARVSVEAVRSLNDDVRAVVEILPDSHSSASQTGQVFAGVPFLIKDLGATQAGVRSELSSRLGAGLVPEETSEVIRRFMCAGMQNIGRSAASEFALLTTTETVLNGTTCTPWSTGHSAGGSSGGAAAAVASGMVPIAHGNDAGGSLRIPAACCGVVGLKPTRGRISNAPAGNVAFGWMTEFAVTRTMRDTASLLDALAGPVAGDPPVSYSDPGRGFADEIGQLPTGARVGVCHTPWSGSPSVDQLSSATKDAAQALSDGGCHVEEACPTFAWEEFAVTQFTLFAALHHETVNQVARATGRAPSEDNLEPHTWAVYQAGRDVTATDLLSALETMDRLSRSIGEFFGRYDLLMTPTIPALTSPVGSADAYSGDDGPEEIKAIWAERGTYTDPFNMTGHPAISLPTTLSDQRLPIGVQLVSGFHDEASLIRCGSFLEDLGLWITATPPIHVSRVSE